MGMAGAELLVGWAAIAKYIGVCERSLRARKQMLADAEVIFYRRGRFGKRVICAWSDDLRGWAKKHLEMPVGTYQSKGRPVSLRE
jgi:hypothetical protein